jgi:glycosyltransferase involved in cell wall biosynthesis
LSLSLSLVVPAYNEGENVGVVARHILEVCRREEIDLELLLVDDGSGDDTQTRCKQLALGHPAVRVLVHERNRGLSAALRTGYEAARKDWITWLPADGQVDADQLPILLSPIREGRADMVISTVRRRPDPIARLVISKVFRMVLEVGIGFGDRLEGTYVFQRPLFERMTLVSTRGAGSIAFEIAAKAKALGARVASVEVECKPRRAGVSKVGQHMVRNTLESLGEVWRIRKSMRK